MISAYGGIRWGTGMVRQFQYEKTQSRIGAPPWDAPLQFIENSPIFWVESIHTPYLTIHNDGDDAVPWYQGIEFNTAMRRLGKEAYMFNYNGERARPAQPRQHEALDRAHGRVLRPLPARQAAAGVDGQGRQLSSIAASATCPGCSRRSRVLDLAGAHRR